MSKLPNVDELEMKQCIFEPEDVLSITDYIRCYTNDPKAFDYLVAADTYCSVLNKKKYVTPKHFKKWKIRHNIRKYNIDVSEKYVYLGAVLVSNAYILMAIGRDLQEKAEQRRDMELKN